MLAMSEFGHSRHFELALHGAPCSLVDEHNDACFIVRGPTGQALGYFFFEDEPGRRSAAKTPDEGRGAAAGGKLRQAARIGAATIAQGEYRPPLVGTFRIGSRCHLWIEVEIFLAAPQARHDRKS